MPQDYGAAQPIIDLATRARDKTRSLLGRVPGKSVSAPAADSSWHDEMVRQANRSFQQRAEAERAAAAAPAAKSPVKRTPKRASARTSRPASGKRS